MSFYYYYFYINCTRLKNKRFNPSRHHFKSLNHIFLYEIVGSPQLETSTLNAKQRSGLPIGQRPFTPAAAASGGPADPWAWRSVQRIGSNNPHYPEIISQPIPANNRPLHQSGNRASSDLEQGGVYRSRKITLIECNAKCRYLKRLTCKWT